MRYIILIHILLLTVFSPYCYSFMEDQLDINMASVQELMLLDGIDQDLATLIVEHRNTKGEFKDIEELIPLVTSEIFERIKFDVIARPIKDRYKNAINGRLKVERGESYSNDSQPHAYWNLSTNFNILDQVNGYILYNNFEMDYGKIKHKQYFERSIGINLFKRENILDEKKILSSPEPKVFKRIDLEKQQQKKEKRIKNYFEKAFGEQLLTGDEKNTKVHGYFGSSGNYVDYLSRQYSKNVVEKDTSVVPRYKERKYGQPVKIDLSKSKQLIDAKKEQDNKPRKKIRKTLTTKILLGDVSTPYKKRPLISAYGQGIKVINLHKHWENSFFYIADHSSNEQATAGASVTFNMKDRTKITSSLYQIRDMSYKNNFDNFQLAAEKKKHKTEFYIEYDNLLGMAHGVYGKVSSSIKNMKYSLSVNFVESDYNDFNDIYPFKDYYRYIADVMDANFALTWYFMKNSSMVIDMYRSMMTNDKYSSGEYQDSSSKGTGANLYLNYKPNSKLSSKLVLGKGEGGSGDSSKAEIELNYKFNKKYTGGFRHSISNKKNADDEYDYNKLYIDTKLSKDVRWTSYFQQTLSPSKTRELTQKVSWQILGNLSAKFDHNIIIRDYGVNHELMIKLENKF